MAVSTSLTMQMQHSGASERGLGASFNGGSCSGASAGGAGTGGGALARGGGSESGGTRLVLPRFLCQQLACEHSLQRSMKGLLTMQGQLHPAYSHWPRVHGSVMMK